MMRSASEEFWVMKVRPRKERACMVAPSEVFRLMVEPSNDGSASAGMDFRGGGGVGISHAFSFGAREKSRVNECTACVHVPAIGLLSALNLPSYAVPLISMANFTVGPSCEMEETLNGCGVSSML